MLYLAEIELKYWPYMEDSYTPKDKRKMIRLVDAEDEEEAEKKIRNKYERSGHYDTDVSVESVEISECIV